MLRFVDPAVIILFSVIVLPPIVIDDVVNEDTFKLCVFIDENKPCRLLIESDSINELTTNVLKIVFADPTNVFSVIVVPPIVIDDVVKEDTLRLFVYIDENIPC